MASAEAAATGASLSELADVSTTAAGVAVTADGGDGDVAVAVSDGDVAATTSDDGGNSDSPVEERASDGVTDDAATAVVAYDAPATNVLEEDAMDIGGDAGAAPAAEPAAAADGKDVPTAAGATAAAATPLPPTITTAAATAAGTPSGGGGGGGGDASRSPRQLGQSTPALGTPSSSSSAAAAAAANVRLEGYLSKPGSKSFLDGLTWKRRYFSLDTERYVIEYFKSRGGDKVGEIDIAEATNAMPYSEKKGKRYNSGFLINTPARTWKLAASSAFEAEKWVEGIMLIITHKQNTRRHAHTMRLTKSVRVADERAGRQRDSMSVKFGSEVVHAKGTGGAVGAGGTGGLHITYVPGEQHLYKQPYVVLQLPDGIEAECTGTLVLTNFRLRFFPEDDSIQETRDVPLTAINRVNAKGNASQSRYRQVEIIAKDTQRLRLGFAAHTGDRKKFVSQLNAAFPQKLSQVFAFSYKPGLHGRIRDSYMKRTPREQILQSLFAAGPGNVGSAEPLSSGARGGNGGVGGGGGGAGAGAGGRVSQLGRGLSIDYGWNVYKPAEELARQGVPNEQFRVTECNAQYGCCDTYPSTFAVPAAVTDEAIDAMSKYRRRGRVQALVWRHPENGASIHRCAQPRVGLTRARCEEDEAYFATLLATSRADSLLIVDARPKVNAVANQAKGAGFEITSNYPNCHLEFFNIENIHVMRSSFYALCELVQNTASNSEDNFLSALEGTRWLNHLKLVLQASVTIMSVVEEQAIPVVIHCSDGWDRTAQLSSLASVLLDPFYRTLRGFTVLIEKEWCAFGHKFADRCGVFHGEKPDEESPIFLQFLDCVWQVMQQFPCSFQFNSEYLLAIAHHAYSGQFGTFLCNNEKDRLDSELLERTVSLWTDLREQKEYYINLYYDKSSVDEQHVLRPVCNIQKLSVWSDLYYQYNVLLRPQESTKAALSMLLERVLALGSQKKLVAKVIGRDSRKFGAHGGIGAADGADVPLDSLDDLYLAVQAADLKVAEEHASRSADAVGAAEDGGGAVAVPDGGDGKDAVAAPTTHKKKKDLKDLTKTDQLRESALMNVLGDSNDSRDAAFNVIDSYMSDEGLA